MDRFQKYFDLMQENHSIFQNPGGEGVIRIIEDPDEIQKEQQRIALELRKQGKPVSWIEIGVLVDDPWFYVIRDLVEFPDGKVGGYIRLINRKNLEGGFGVVLLVVQGGKSLLLKHFRHNDRRWYWEFPRGFGEPGLSAEENAHEELMEEIGVTDALLTELGVEREGKGGDVFFYVELPVGEKVTLNRDEGISEMRWLSFQELEEWIVAGKVYDRFTLKAYLLAKIKGLI